MPSRLRVEGKTSVYTKSRHPNQPEFQPAPSTGAIQAAQVQELCGFGSLCSDIRKVILHLCVK